MFIYANNIFMCSFNVSVAVFSCHDNDLGSSKIKISIDEAAFRRSDT